MTWPTSSKASNQNVDQASDRISDARTDILQNIQNTNAIINKFDLTSLADAQILVGSGSNTFENRDQIFISPYFAYIVYGSPASGLTESEGGVGEDSSSLNYRYFAPTQKFDPADLYNVAGYDSTNDSTVVNSVFTVEAGTYSFHIQDIMGVNTDNDTDPAFGIQVIKPDGTKFENIVETTENAGVGANPDNDYITSEGTFAMFDNSVGIYNVSLPAQSVIRTFLTNNNDNLRITQSFVLKITKG